MKKIKLIIQGLGNWAKLFLDLTNIEKVNNLFTIAAIISRDKTHFRNRIEKYYPSYPLLKSVKIYDSLKKGVSEIKPDAIYIATPDFAHIDSLYDILNSKIPSTPHLLIEKPLNSDIKNCLKALKLFGYKHLSYGNMIPKNDSPFIMIGWHKKFSLQNIYFIQNYLKNDNGDLKSIRVSILDQKRVFSNSYINWANKTELFSFLGGHFFDIIYDSFKNSFPVSITSNANYENNTMVEANVCLGLSTLKSNEVVPVNLTISCNEPNNSYAMTEQNITYIFRKNRITIDTTGKDFELIDDQGIHLTNVHGKGLVKDPWDKSDCQFGYTYQPQLRWLKTVFDLVNNNIKLEEAVRQYPLSVLTEFTINACLESLKLGSKYGNLVFGKNMKLNANKITIL